MRHALITLAVGLPLITAPVDNTGWLASGHPRIEVMFDHRMKEGCTADCDRYAMLLRYQSSVPATSSELTEWDRFTQAGCVDVVTQGKSSFACRVTGTMARTTDDGRRTAISRFHVTRAQLQDLAAGAAVRVGEMSLRLPAEARAALSIFLQPAT